MPGQPARPCSRIANDAAHAASISLALLLTLASALAANARAVDLEERVPVAGAELYLLTRGDDRAAPVLMWLHGGPGGAERPLFRLFNAELERRFVVAYLDQRGAGRSFDPAAEPSQLTVARQVADLDAIVDHLRGTLGAEKVALVGHSWGGMLALLYAREHPGKVSKVVGVAPLISARAAQDDQYAFVLEQSTARNDADALRQLRELGPPPHETADKVLAMERLADRYGAVFHQPPSQTWTLLRGVFSGVATPWEIPSFIRANDVSLAAMTRELLELDLRRSLTRLEVPVVFMLGRFDRHLSSTISASYLDALTAPSKKTLWFEHSAHNPPFEEPELFDAMLAQELE